MFGFLKKIFKKKEGQTPIGPQQEVALPAAAEIKEREVVEEETTQQKMEKMAAKEKSFSGDPERPEKNCPKCGAPNDTFVDICWMCKEKI
jgi:hypothetical protein